MCFSPAVGQDATPGAPVTATTRVAPRSVPIGTPFRYTMRVEATGEVELIVPILAERLGDFVITDFGEVPQPEEEGRVVVERWYSLVTYETGDQIVPGPSVQYRLPGSDLQYIAAPDALIIVESVLAQAGGEAGVDDVRDIKGPVAVPRDYRPLWWGLGGLLLLAGLAVGLYRLVNRSRKTGGPPPRPAHEVALEALLRLRGAHLLDAGRQTEYYVRLSGIVRAYLEGRFRLRAPEMTSEEFLLVAQRSPQLASEHRSLLAQFLTEADLVKFARYLPSLDDSERAYGAARQFIESTARVAEDSRAAA